MTHVAVKTVLCNLPDDECAKLEQARHIAKRVIRDAKQIVHSWAVLSNFQRRIHEDEMVGKWLPIENPSGLIEVIDALYLTAILAFMRMTDNPGTDRQTACSLVGYLENEAVYRAVTDERWLQEIERQLGWAGVPATSRDQSERIGWLLARVPKGWGRDAVEPGCRQLVDARGALRGLRNHRFAHSTPHINLDWPSVQELAAIMKFAAELSNTVQAIFLVDSATLQLSFTVEPMLGGVWDDLFEGIRRRNVSVPSPQRDFQVVAPG